MGDRGSDSQRSHFALVQSHVSTGVGRGGRPRLRVDPVVKPAMPRYWESPIYAGLLAGGPLTEALEDERAEGRAIVRVHITRGRRYMMVWTIRWSRHEERIYILPKRRLGPHLWRQAIDRSNMGGSETSTGDASDDLPTVY